MIHLARHQFEIINTCNILPDWTCLFCFFSRRFFESQPLSDRDELLQNMRVNTSSASQLKSTGKLISFFHGEKVSLRFMLLDLEKKTYFIHQNNTFIIYVQQASFHMFAKLLKQSYMGRASIGCVCFYISVIVGLWWC